MAELSAQTTAAANGQTKETARIGAPGAVAVPARRELDDHPAWPMLSRLPAMLAVSIPLNRFRVIQLLNLECGQTIGSAWAVTEDVPLRVGALQICWGEFEVVEQRMALRLTRLA